MYEIELKAHVPNPDEVRQALNSFAEYKGQTFKRDKYYKIPSEKSEKGYEKFRVRIENGASYLTYKTKTKVKNPDGSFMEVNSESECKIDNFETIEKLFTSLGAQVSFEKTKDVEHWYYFSHKQNIHIELCDVCKLGYFIEIEVMSDKNDDNTVNKIREQELDILDKCKIGRDQIESKF